MLNDFDYDEINRRVDERMSRERNRGLIGLFAANLIIFLVFMTLVWLVLPNVGSWQGVISTQLMLSLILLSVGWLTGLIMHAVTALMAAGVMNKATRERLTAEEIQREIKRVGLDVLAQREKPKRHDRLTLTEDGELLEVADEETARERRTGA